MSVSPDHVTLMLQAVAAGERDAATDLLPLLYDELRALARARMAGLPAGHTLQPTALVHEAYARLVGQRDPGWDSRAHFFGAAAQAMRQILVEYARRKSRLKRGGDRRQKPIKDEALADLRIALPKEDILALDEALQRLEQAHPRKARVVMLRYFAGLTIEEVAAMLGVSTRSVNLDWEFAKTWLFDALSPGDE